MLRRRSPPTPILASILRGGIVEQPAQDVLDLLDLGGYLARSQLVVHDVGQDPGRSAISRIGNLELIQVP